MVGGMFLAMATVACNNDDINQPTLEEAITTTTDDVEAFLETFTINDLDILENGKLKSGLKENDIRIIKLNDDGSVPESASGRSSGKTFSDYLEVKEGQPLLIKDTLNVGSTGREQVFYYIILREGLGKKVYRRDPSLIAFQIPEIIQFESDKKEFLALTTPESEREFFWSTELTDFTAFDIVRSKMRSGIREFSETNECFGGNIKKEDEDRSGVALMIIPGTLSTPSPSFNDRGSFVFTFSILNTQRTDPDGDGILTIYEDLDGDGDPTNDNTDAEPEDAASRNDDIEYDNIPNYLDPDDDGDDVLTLLEVELVDLGEDDENCDNDKTNDFAPKVPDDGLTPAYLDPNK